jgi:hypothetical protein
MLGRYQNVFRSRWKALWWAAGILLTAYCTVPSQEEGVAPDPATSAPHHVNPWAADPRK